MEKRDSFLLDPAPREPIPHVTIRFMMPMYAALLRWCPASRLRCMIPPIALVVMLAATNAAAQDPEPIRPPESVNNSVNNIAPADTSARRPGSHNVVVNGVRLWYRVAGDATTDAPPVIFLHGGPGQGSAHFDALAGPYLEPMLQLVYLDQRGSGHSERPWTNAYSIDVLVDDIEGLRQHLGAPKISLIGHSFGGLLALEYAARHPDHVSHVVFVAGVWDMALQCRLRLERLGELRPDVYARVKADTLDAEGVRRSDCELEFQAFERQEERERYNIEAMFPDPNISAHIDSVNNAHGIQNTGELSRALFASGLHHYRFISHDRITMPVLVIAGRHDGAARPAGLQALADRLPDARFVEYERSGHFVYLDESERFARDISTFLSTSAGDVHAR